MDSTPLFNDKQLTSDSLSQSPIAPNVVSVSPEEFHLKQNIPWTLVFLVAGVIFSATAVTYVYFSVTTSAQKTSDELSMLRDPEIDPIQQEAVKQKFADLFAPPTVSAAGNPFATPTPGYTNPFGEYQNPFALASSDGSREFENPFQ